VRQLLPHPLDEVDPAGAYAADARPRHEGGRPWVLVNMIASLDGGTAVDGVSGPLGGPADKQVFRAIRAVADVILVGAGTVRAEGYGPASGAARIAVVTASGDLDPGLRVFRDAAGPHRTLVVTAASCPPGRRAALAEVADVVVAGDERVDLRRALHKLAGLGAAVVLAEGGPSLNGQLVANDLVDEWCLTLSPSLVAGSSPRAASGPAPTGAPLRFRLDRLLVADDGLCFLRYVRAPVTAASTAR
jgi:riboflavin biosynthesis pyrimidine reductase